MVNINIICVRKVKRRLFKRSDKRVFKKII